MELLTDFHAHIYANYDLREALTFAQARTSGPVALVLTERFDCDFFKSLKQGSVSAGENLRVGEIDDNCLRLGSRLFLFRGRQYATKEGIEVLSLLAAPKLDEKLPAQNYCDQIINEGGIVAFSWAFGKWCGKRGRLIEILAENIGTEKCVLLDSRLRPSVLSLPASFVRLSNKGFKIYAGSDPLPLKTHQSELGSFASLLPIQGAQINSAAVMSAIQTATATTATIEGQRQNVFAFARDQIRLRL